MKIHGNFRPVDLALFLETQNTLVLGDIHIGFDEAIQKEGVLLPKFHFKDLIAKLELILKQTNPSTIIINGDIKHEFGTISDEEWRNVLKLIDGLNKKYELILVKGNHDVTVEPIAKKRNLKLEDYKLLDDIYIYHGDKLPTNKDFKQAKTIVISHDHPALALKEGSRIEKYRCFLIGDWEDKQIIVLPAFSPTASGSDILKEKMMSPLLKDIKNFQIIVSEENKLYDFGKVKQLK